MEYFKTGQKSYRKALVALFVGSFVSFMILYSVQTLFPLFAEEFHVTPAVASLSLSVSTGCLAVTMLVAATLSNTIGRKQIMTFSLVLSSFLCILASFSPNFAILITTRALQGIALAGFPSIAMTYINEEFHPNHLGLIMGIYVSGNTVGGLAGRFISGLMTDLFSWRSALLIIGGTCLALSIWFIKTLPEPRHFKRTTLSPKTFFPSLLYQLKDVRLLCLFGLSFVLMGSFVTVYNYLGFRLTSSPFYLSQTLIGFIFFLYLVGTFSSTFMGKVSDAIGKPKAILTSILIMLIGGLLTLSLQLLIMIVALAIFTFGFFGSHAIASSWVGQLAEKHKSQAASLYLFCYYLGSSVIGTSSGWVFGGFGWNGIVLLISTLIGFAFLFVSLILICYRSHQKVIYNNIES
ncbi:MFS transporter [Halalkalibacter urbisdiaboli]|uniref:MFS transporter n=1 Tax=Halalkalibacter urbisdiaboli TaxID=1960589 RepID=UPI000B4403BE|nr:MFS transporter [Halalkalibacter urbisdiaboli]